MSRRAPLTPTAARNAFIVWVPQLMHEGMDFGNKKFSSAAVGLNELSSK